MDAFTAHLGALRDPEMVPEGVVGRVRDARVESNLLAASTLGRADGPGESQRVIVRIVVTERRFGTVEQVLPVHECHGANRIRGRHR
jgi:hypothetical protein